jgi:hypothetical protein
MLVEIKVHPYHILLLIDVVQKTTGHCNMKLKKL